MNAKRRAIVAVSWVVLILFSPIARDAGGSLPASIAAQEAPVAAEPDSSVPQEDGVPEPIGQAQAQSDETIRSELQAVLDRIPEFASIEVSVEAGVVRLEGSVLESESAEEAADLARTFEGVRFVIDGTEEVTSVEERLEPTWRRLREFTIGALTAVPLLVVAFGIVVLAWLFGRVLRRIRLPAALRAKNPFLQSLLQGALQGVVVLAGILIALDLLDATALVGAIAGTAGLAGLAVGFAFKDIVENYLAGVLLGFRPPFSKNDHVVAADHEGKVVRLTLRNTILMTLDGNHVSIPNSKIFGSTVLNYSRNPKRRFSFDFGLGPADDVAAAQDLGVDTLRSMRSVLNDPGPSAVTMDLGDSTVQIRFLAWVDQRETDLAAVRGEAIRLVKFALEEAGFELPSPEYQLRVLRVPSGSQEADSMDATKPPPRVPESERDTSVDRALDKQITEDRRSSSEEDLLEDAPAT